MLKKQILFFLFFFACFFDLQQLPLEAKNKRPSHIPPPIWEQVKPYLIPADHPAKSALDDIFEQGRPISSKKALEEAGFKDPKERKFTKVIVTSHPNLPGYLIKAYTDKSDYHHGRPEWVTWLSRIRGAELLEQEIDRLGYKELFKVPKKWIYLLPHPERSIVKKRRKDFILVVEKMDLISPLENKKRWQSRLVDQNFLRCFFTLITTLGLSDAAKPANAPFCRDGKIAFIDTESFGCWPIYYEKLTQWLHNKSKVLWCDLAATACKAVRSECAKEGRLWLQKACRLR